MHGCVCMIARSTKNPVTFLCCVAQPARVNRLHLPPRISMRARNRFSNERDSTYVEVLLPPLLLLAACSIVITWSIARTSCAGAIGIQIVATDCLPDPDFPCVLIILLTAGRFSFHDRHSGIFLFSTFLLFNI